MSASLFDDLPVHAPVVTSVDIAGKLVGVKIERRNGRIVDISSETSNEPRAAAVRAVSAGLRNGRTLDEQCMRVHAARELIAELLAIERGAA